MQASMDIEHCNGVKMRAMRAMIKLADSLVVQDDQGGEAEVA